MRPWSILATFTIVAVAPAFASAQPLPELPPPRPVQPAPVPVPMPGPSPRALALAKIAAESNRYRPACVPDLPTPGLWDGQPSCAHYSWQQWWLVSRDFLGWCCTRPTPAAGMRLPPNASLFDWMTQWLRHDHPATGLDVAPPDEVVGR